MNASQDGGEFFLQAEAVMIIVIFVHQTGHFSSLYDMDRYAELLLLMN